MAWWPYAGWQRRNCLTCRQTRRRITPASERVQLLVTPRATSEGVPRVPDSPQLPPSRAAAVPEPACPCHKAGTALRNRYSPETPDSPERTALAVPPPTPPAGDPGGTAERP